MADLQFHSNQGYSDESAGGLAGKSRPQRDIESGKEERRGESLGGGEHFSDLKTVA